MNARGNNSIPPSYSKQIINQSINKFTAMTGPSENTVTFNVGGHHYQVSRSLLDLEPHCMLTRAASETWCRKTSCGDCCKEDFNSFPPNHEHEIYIDRNGSRFQYVLDYLRDGRIILPMTECREAIIQELHYFNIGVEEDKVYYSSQGSAVQGLKVLQQTVLKWRCADLAADCLEACWNEKNQWKSSLGSKSKNNGRGDKMYLTFRPHRFHETQHAKEGDIIEWCNEHLAAVGMQLTSIEFDRGNQKCRAILQLIDPTPDTW